MHTLALLVFVQMPWTSHLPQHGIAVDALRPKFDGSETSLTSAGYYFSGRLRTGSGFSLHFEMPFAHLSAQGESSAAIGNPYVGVENTSGKITYEGGVRPALAPDDEFASLLGVFSDVTRFEAFIPHLATLSGRVIYRSQSSSGTTFEIGGGPSVWIPTEGGDTEVILHHFGSLGYRGSKVWMAFGIGGLLTLTGDGDFAGRTIYQLGASLGLTQGSVRPALHAIVPMDEEFRNSIDFVLGLGVAIPIK